jgi:polyhydroxyalkanoate synthesis regulator phasin
MPKKTLLAAKYPRLSEIHNKLENQNYAIYQREQQLSGLEQELANTKGIFKRKERKELQGQIDQLKPQIKSMKRYLSGIVQEYGYKTVKEFLTEYSTAKAENAAYKKAVADWEKKYVTKAEPDSIRARLEYHKQQVKKQENSRQRTYRHSADRGAR